MLVRSTGLGRVRLWVVQVGFGFHCWCRHFGRIRQVLARSRRELVGSQRDLARSRRIWTKSWRDLVVSCPIWLVWSKFSLENAGFCMFSSENSKYLWKFLVIHLGRVARVLGEETANRPTDVGFCGRRPTTDSRSGWFGQFSVRVRESCSG